MYCYGCRLPREATRSFIVRSSTISFQHTARAIPHQPVASRNNIAPVFGQRVHIRPEVTKSLMEFQLNLDSETVDHIGFAKPICVAPGTSVHDVFQVLKEHGEGAVLVCRDGALIGIFTERDALRLMASQAGLDVAVEEVMTAAPVTLNTSDTVSVAISTMANGGFRQLPIMDAEGKPVGLQHVAHILHFLVQHFPGIIYNLPPAPNPTQQTREGA